MKDMIHSKRGEVDIVSRYKGKFNRFLYLKAFVAVSCFYGNGGSADIQTV